MIDRRAWASEAAGVRRLLGDRVLRERLVHCAAERVEQEFSEAAVVAQWKALFADYGVG